MNQSSGDTAILGICSEHGDMLEFRLQPGITIIGRKPHLYAGTVDESGRKTLALTLDGRVSRVHLRISYLPALNKLAIEDLDSLNGTYINGKRIEEKMDIDADTRIQIGHTNIIFLAHPKITPVIA